jgi:hypothetical protein
VRPDMSLEAAVLLALLVLGLGLGSWLVLRR